MISAKIMLHSLLSVGRCCWRRSARKQQGRFRRYFEHIGQERGCIPFKCCSAYGDMNGLSHEFLHGSCMIKCIVQRIVSETHCEMCTVRSRRFAQS